MKRVAGLFALAFAVPGLAHAAGTLKGTYAVHYTTLCQSLENEVFKKTGTSQQTEIDTIDEGTLQQSIGFITFTPSTAGANLGKISAQLTQAKGSLAILGLPGGTGQPAQPAVPDMKIQSGPQTGTYTLTLGTGSNPAILKITFTKQTPENFTAYLSKLTAAVYGHADFEDTDVPIGGKDHCINSGTIDLQ
jgi:hypothetical protein